MAGERENFEDWRYLYGSATLKKECYQVLFLHKYSGSMDTEAITVIPMTSRQQMCMRHRQATYVSRAEFSKKKNEKGVHSIGDVNFHVL